MQCALVTAGTGACQVFCVTFRFHVEGRVSSRSMLETKAQSQTAGSTRWSDLVVGQLDLAVHISFTGIRHFVTQILLEAYA